jgi:hypothetical protein
MLKSREDELEGHAVLMREKKRLQILTRNTEARNPLGMARRRWEDIKETKF